MSQEAKREQRVMKESEPKPEPPPESQDGAETSEARGQEIPLVKPESHDQIEKCEERVVRIPSVYVQPSGLQRVQVRGIAEGPHNVLQDV